MFKVTTCQRAAAIVNFGAGSPVADLQLTSTEWCTRGAHWVHIDSKVTTGRKRGCRWVFVANCCSFQRLCIRTALIGSASTRTETHRTRLLSSPFAIETPSARCCVTPCDECFAFFPVIGTNAGTNEPGSPRPRHAKTPSSVGDRPSSRPRQAIRAE